MKKVFIFLFLLILQLFICENRLWALNFQIDKGKIRMRMPVGWSDGGVINVTNKDKDPVSIRVYAGDWVYSSQDGEKNFMPVGTNANSCAEWIKFYPADFTLNGFEKKEVSYVVAVPSSASGGYYATLFFEMGAIPTVSDHGVVNVYNRLASLFYVEVEGTIKRGGQIYDLSIRKKEKDNLEVKAIFENSGNVDITTKGTIDIMDKESMVVGRGEFNEVYTLPKDKAQLGAILPVIDLKVSEYDLILTFDLGGDILVKEYSLTVKKGDVIDIQEINKEVLEK